MPRRTTDTLWISPRALRRIAEAAEAAYPAEACGFLVAPARGADTPHALVEPDASSGTTVVDAVPAANRAERPDRYFIDARDVWEAMKASREADRRLVGVYHSHPDGDPDPSATDVDDAWGEWFHLIVACRAGVAGEARAWRFREGEFRPLELIVSETGKRKGER